LWIECRSMKWLIVFCIFFAGLDAKSLAVNTRAKAALVMNADTGVVLYEKNGYTQAYPASTTKIATALYALSEKKLDLQSSVLVSAEAVRRNPGKRTDDTPSHWMESDATIMGLVKGERLTLDALFHGMLLISGNDAANVIGETASGSVPKFVEELNQYLFSIGCKSTRFMNPHGYHHPHHVSTPYDLCLMFKKGLESPSFRQIMSRSTYLRPKSNKRAEEEICSFNQLMNPTKKIFYPKAIGGKTGFHSLAGRCFVTAATHEGRTLILCLLGCEKNNERFEEARRIFEVAFAEKKVERLFIPGSQRFTKEIVGAKDKLTASIKKNLSMSFFPSEEPEVKAYIHWNPTTLPIAKGSVVGEVRIVDDRGVVVISESLVAMDDVKGTFLHKIKESFKWLYR
jgi:D-alanyl-D-alanine carboxypeptidase (penicillin-binding protein 5/6)